mmetsp:Transcript_17704/g.30974  ORF Transcript_17704/g.30974 Transcript_17704/m.30974 type:complete len:355 (+) Transcript_17704:29-1093(+)
MSSPAPAPEMDVDVFSDTFWKTVSSSFAQTAQDVVFRLVYALIILIIGYIIIRIVLFFVDRAMRLRKWDASLAKFFHSAIKGILWLLLITAVIEAVNLEIVSLAGIVAALGLAIGLTVGGLMSNFVAGVVLLMRKPFVVGELIDAQGVMGKVTSIDMFMTTVLSPDNKVITIPNLPLATEELTNISREENRRIDLVIGVAYDADLALTKKVLKRACTRHTKVLPEPAVNVQVSELGDSSVNFIVRPWVKTPDYFDTKCDLLRDIKNALDKAKIGIPFPNMDVHLFEGEAGEPANFDDLSLSSTTSEDEAEVVDDSLANNRSLSEGLRKRASNTTKKFKGMVKKVSRSKKPDTPQ